MKSELDWKSEILHCYRNMGLDGKQVAQLQFLQVVRDLKCTDCFECLVRTGEGFPMDFERESELKLAVTCCGLLFFAKDPCECLLPVDFGHIEHCLVNGGKVRLLTNLGSKKVEFEFETVAGSKILEAVVVHKKDLQMLHDSNLSVSQLPSSQEQHLLETFSSQTAIQTVQTSEAEGRLDPETEINDLHVERGTQERSLTEAASDFLTDGVCQHRGVHSSFLVSSTSSRDVGKDSANTFTARRQDTAKRIENLFSRLCKGGTLKESMGQFILQIVWLEKWLDACVLKTCTAHSP